jgi:hypothetical protein
VIKNKRGQERLHVKKSRVKVYHSRMYFTVGPLVAGDLANE